jgi:hypothetical protein
VLLKAKAQTRFRVTRSFYVHKLAPQTNGRELHCSSKQRNDDEGSETRDGPADLFLGWLWSNLEDFQTKDWKERSLSAGRTMTIQSPVVMLEISAFLAADFGCNSCHHQYTKHLRLARPVHHHLETYDKRCSLLLYTSKRPFPRTSKAHLHSLPQESLFQFLSKAPPDLFDSDPPALHIKAAIKEE